VAGDGQRLFRSAKIRVYLLGRTRLDSGNLISKRTYTVSLRPADSDVPEVTAMRTFLRLTENNTVSPMARHLLLLSIVVCWAASPPERPASGANAAGGKSSALGTTTTLSAAPTAKPLVAMLEFTTDNLPPGEMDAVGAALWERLLRSGRVRLLSRRDTRIALRQMGLLPRRPLAQPSSYGRMARALGVDYLAFGHVGGPGGIYALDVSLFSVRKGATVITETRICEGGLQQMLAEMGEVAQGSIHYHALFGLGIVLFLLTFVINLAAATTIFKKRRRGGLR